MFYYTEQVIAEVLKTTNTYQPIDTVMMKHCAKS